jgi:hypothetical protein
MLKQRLAILFAAGALLAGLGVASAFAEGQQPAQPTTTATATENENEQGDDEQGTANDVAEAADDVEFEATNPTADDEQGDDQGQDENDDSQEPGDD